MGFVVKPDEIEAWELHEGSKIKMVMNGRNMTTIVSEWAPRSSFPCTPIPTNSGALPAGRGGIYH